LFGGDLTRCAAQKQSDYERLAQRRKAVKEKLEQCVTSFRCARSLLIVPDRYRREKEQELVEKQAMQQVEEQKRGAQRRAEVLKFLQMVTKPFCLHDDTLDDAPLPFRDATIPAEVP
jgi:uncharacterized protein involved in tolerance to divalent cations